MKKSVTVQLQKKSDENRHCEPERQRGRSNLFFRLLRRAKALLAMTRASRTELLQKSGITLVEMIVAMLLSTIIVSALACQFVAMVRFNTVLQNTIDAERDAYTIVNGMTRILRFADPNSIVFFSSAVSSGFTATIKTDNLVGFAMSGDHTVRYSESGTRPMPFPVLISWDGNSPTSLSEYFSFWDGSSSIYNSATQELSISFDITKGQTTIPIRTKIKVRGDL